MVQSRCSELRSFSCPQTSHVLRTQTKHPKCVHLTGTAQKKTRPVHLQTIAHATALTTLTDMHAQPDPGENTNFTKLVETDKFSKQNKLLNCRKRTRPKNQLHFQHRSKRTRPKNATTANSRTITHATALSAIAQPSFTTHTKNTATTARAENIELKSEIAYDLDGGYDKISQAHSHGCRIVRTE